VRQVRAAACLALGAWGDLAGSACTPVAQVLVARSVPRVLAAEALAQMGPEGEECLRQLVHEEEVGDMAARHACPVFPHIHFVCALFIYRLLTALCLPPRASLDGSVCACLLLERFQSIACLVGSLLCVTYLLGFM
jgi:hypothetical protein